MQVLVHLASHPNEVLSKDRLLEAVWHNTFVGDDVLVRCISELRYVFGDDPKSSRVIQTIPKSGYRLIATVTTEVPKNIEPTRALTSEPENVLRYNVALDGGRESQVAVVEEASRELTSWPPGPESGHVAGGIVGNTSVRRPVVGVVQSGVEASSRHFGRSPAALRFWCCSVVWPPCMHGSRRINPLLIFSGGRCSAVMSRY